MITNLNAVSGANPDADIEYTKIVLEPGDRTLTEIFSGIREENIHVVFREGLYFSGGTELDCLLIRKEHVVLEGEGNVVLYDNRGHMVNAHPYPRQGSSLAHTVLIDARTVRISNITFVNGCNIDFRYGDTFLPRVSDVITQAYAFGGWNIRKLEIDNSKFYSILDTFSLKDVEEVCITNSYVQGNNDFIAVGRKTYHYNCEFRNMGPCPMWAAMDGYMVFDRCTFRLDRDVESFSFTKRGGNIAFLDSDIFGNVRNLRMEIEPKRESRYYLYHTEYNGRKAEFEGFDESFIELTDSQYLTVHGREFETLRLDVAGSTVVEGETVLELGAVPDRVEASDNVQCRREGNRVTVNSNITGRDQEAWIDISAGFLRQRVYLTVVGKKVLDPVLSRGLSYRIEGGKLTVDYEVRCPEGIVDLSCVDVYQEDALLYRMTAHDCVDILKSDVGRAFRLVLRARTEETRETVSEALYTRTVLPEDVGVGIKMKNMRCYLLDDRSHFHMDKSVFAYEGDETPNFVRFDHTDDRPFTYAYGTDGAKGIQGLLYTGRGACFIYPVAEALRGLELGIDLAVEKSSGEGFGSANGQYLELFVNYDHGTRSGTALRLEREAVSDRGVFLSVREYRDGVNRTISEKVFTKLYKTYCRLSVRYADRNLEFALSHNGERDSLKVPCGECSSAFMLRCSGTTGVGNRFLILGLDAEFMAVSEKNCR